jgi:AAA domain-containing protein
MEDSLRLFEFLFQPGEAIEVRVVAPWCGSGFFDNAKDLGQALSELDGLRPEAVYCSLNPVTREAFERSPNQFQKAKSGVRLACRGEDILRRSWILGDLDPIRLAKASSTDVEKDLARLKMREVESYLLSEGTPPMVVADSGNGFHLLIPCDLPNDRESAQLVKGFLEFLSAKFTDANVKVDTVNWNADRITKAYGTTARKGPNTPERPHRRSGIIALPTSTSPVSRDLLERMQLKPLPKATESIIEFSERQIAKLTEWSRTIPDFPAIKTIKRDTAKVTIIPNHCYLNPDHTGTSAGIVFHSDGGRGNACKHDGCNMPFAEWWKLVEKKYGRELPIDPKVVMGSKKFAPAPSRDWTLQNYAAVQVEQIPWIFRNLLALKKATALVGEPGGGKSLFTVDLAARITRGRGFPDGAKVEIQPSSVLMLNSEDGAGDTIKPRFLAAGGDPERLYQIILPMGVQFSVDAEEDMQRLDEQLVAHPDIRCIIIDPILQHVISEKEQDVRRGVSTMLGLLQKHNIALLYVCHFNKVAGKNLSSPLDKLSGAKAWVGLPRFVFAIMADSRISPPVHHLICAKHNISAGIRSQSFAIESASEGTKISDIPRIRWTGESDINMVTLLNLPNDGGSADTVLDRAMNLIESELTDQPRPASEIIAVLNQAGVSARTTDRARSRLVLKGIMTQPKNEGGVWYWRRAA